MLYKEITAKFGLKSVAMHTSGRSRLRKSGEESDVSITLEDVVRMMENDEIDVLIFSRTISEGVNLKCRTIQ